MMRPVPVLLYHHVCREPQPFSSSPELFDRHLAWLRRHGFRSLTLDELRQRIETGDDGPEPEVVITFDDGYAELGTDVADSLRRHGFTAAAFLITSRNPDDEGSAGDDGEARYLSWEQARRLADEGIMEFHSHTHSHQKWPLTADQGPVLAEEIRTSRRLLSERLDRPPSTFDHLAWPYGRACDAWEEEARRLGVDAQYVVQRGAVTRPGQIDRLPRLLADGMSLRTFAAWMTVLSRRPGALAANRVFGTIRARREGAAYV